jgi:SpoVK/Ycf46/Vps4 family AAA+-type ATPase
MLFFRRSTYKVWVGSIYNPDQIIVTHLIHSNPVNNIQKYKSSLFRPTGINRVRLEKTILFSILTNKISNSKKVLELPFTHAKAITTKQTISKKESFFQYLFIEHINNKYSQKLKINNKLFISESASMVGVKLTDTAVETIQKLPIQLVTLTSEERYKKNIEFSELKNSFFLENTDKMSTILENLPSQDKIFINYRKPFLCYWLLPFIGFVTVLKDPSFFKNPNPNNIIITQEESQENQLKENRTKNLQNNSFSQKPLYGFNSIKKEELVNLQNSLSANIFLKSKNLDAFSFHRSQLKDTNSFKKNNEITNKKTKLFKTTDKINKFKEVMDSLFLSILKSEKVIQNSTKDPNSKQYNGFSLVFLNKIMKQNSMLNFSWYLLNNSSHKSDYGQLNSLIDHNLFPERVLPITEEIILDFFSNDQIYKPRGPFYKIYPRSCLVSANLENFHAGSQSSQKSTLQGINLLKDFQKEFRNNKENLTTKISNKLYKSQETVFYNKRIGDTKLNLWNNLFKKDQKNYLTGIYNKTIFSSLNTKKIKFDLKMGGFPFNKYTYMVSNNNIAAKSTVLPIIQAEMSFHMNNLDGKNKYSQQTPYKSLKKALLLMDRTLLSILKTSKYSENLLKKREQFQETHKLIENLRVIQQRDQWIQQAYPFGIRFQSETGLNSTEESMLISFLTHDKLDIILNIFNLIDFNEKNDQSLENLLETFFKNISFSNNNLSLNNYESLSMNSKNKKININRLDNKDLLYNSIFEGLKKNLNKILESKNTIFIPEKESVHSFLNNVKTKTYIGAFKQSFILEKSNLMTQIESLWNNNKHYKKWIGHSNRDNNLIVQNLNEILVNSWSKNQPLLTSKIVKLNHQIRGGSFNTTDRLHINEINKINSDQNDLQNFHKKAINHYKRLLSENNKISTINLSSMDTASMVTSNHAAVFSIKENFSNISRMHNSGLNTLVFSNSQKLNKENNIITGLAEQLDGSIQPLIQNKGINEVLQNESSFTKINNNTLANQIKTDKDLEIKNNNLLNKSKDYLNRFCNKNSFLYLNEYVNFLNTSIKKTLNPYKFHSTYLPELTTYRKFNRFINPLPINNIIYTDQENSSISNQNKIKAIHKDNLGFSFPLKISQNNYLKKFKYKFSSHDQSTPTVEKIFLSYLSKVKKPLKDLSNSFSENLSFKIKKNNQPLNPGSNLVEPVGYFATYKKNFKFTKLKIKNYLKKNKKLLNNSNNFKITDAKSMSIKRVPIETVSFFKSQIHSNFSKWTQLKNFLKYNNTEIYRVNKKNLKKNNINHLNSSYSKLFISKQLTNFKDYSYDIKLLNSDSKDLESTLEKQNIINKSLESNKQPILSKNIVNILRKKQNLKVKRRLKKMKKETRRRKKRKIFFPRPQWITFSLYNKFLNNRYSLNILNTNSAESFIYKKDPSFTTVELEKPLKKGYLSPWTQSILEKKALLINTKDFYITSNNVFTDLRRILMKSNWLRNYLNPYFNKVKKIYKEMQSTSKKTEFYLKLRNFILNFYGSSNPTSFSNSITTRPVGSRQSSGSTMHAGRPSLNNNNKSSLYKQISNSYILSYIAPTWSSQNLTMQSPYQKYQGKINIQDNTMFDINKSDVSLQSISNLPSFDLLKIKKDINFIDYNRIIYQRFQRIILSIKENLNLNGDIKSRSKKLGRNIRAFIKRDYKSNGSLENQQNNPVQNQNSSFWSKFFKNTILKVNNYTSYGYNEFSHNNNLLNLSKTNLVWALNKTNLGGTSSGSIENLYSYPKKVWQAYKIREISKRNKTKKLIFNILTKYDIPLGGISTVTNNSKPLDGFSQILNKKTFNGPSKKDEWFGSIHAVELIPNQNIQESTLSEQSGTFRRMQTGFPGHLQQNILQTSEISSLKDPLKTYTIKSELKLQNIENKLKLLGLYSKKIEKTYKTNYLRSLKQQLYLNSSYILDLQNQKNYHSPWPTVLMDRNSSIQATLLKNFESNNSFLNSTQKFYSDTHINFKKYNQKTNGSINGSALSNSSSLFFNLNNYHKISNNHFYWWSFSKINSNFNVQFLENKTYKKNELETCGSLGGAYIKFNSHCLNNNQNLLLWTSLLFHFSALVSFISLGGVRTLIKFYYILISKLTKLLSQISFIELFKIHPIILKQDDDDPFSLITRYTNSKMVATKFNHTALTEGSLPILPMSASRSLDRISVNSNKSFQIKNNSSEDSPNENSVNLLKLLSEQEVFNPNLKTNLDYDKLGFKKRFFFNNLITRNHLFFLKYILAQNKFTKESINSKNLVDSELTKDLYLSNRKSKFKTLNPLNLWSISPDDFVKKNLFNKNNNNNNNSIYKPAGWILLNKRNNKFLEKQINSQNLTDLSIISKNELKEKKLFSYTNLLYFSSKIFNPNRFLMNFNYEKINDSININKYKTKTIYFSILKLSQIFYGFYQTSFYIKFLLLKSIDLFSVPVSFIYKFFEKPGEYVVDNLAYNFLLEWSADLITTIPDTVDVSTYSYFYKINRNVTPTLLLYNILPLFLSGQLLYSSTHPSLQQKIFNYFLEKNNYITPFLFAMSNSILKRLLNSTLLIFIKQLSEPDLDYINRQKKGIIFWDVWGEYLKQVAEENSINIYELTTDKEEQIKLLSKYEEILIGQSNNLTSINKAPIDPANFSHPFQKPSNHQTNRRKFINILKHKGDTSTKKNQIKSGNSKMGYSMSQLIKSNDSEFKIETTLLKNNWPKEYVIPFLKQYQGNIKKIKNDLMSSSQIFSQSSRKPFRESSETMQTVKMGGLTAGITDPLMKTTQTKNQLMNLINYSKSPVNRWILFDENDFYNKASKFKKKTSNSSNILNNFGSSWAVSQFLSYQGKDTDLFIDLHPPKSFWSIPSLKYSYTVQQPIGSIVCQIFAGIFYKQISKNILVIGSAGLEKSLLIQAMAGETELKIITDNANRYAMVYRGVAVGIKLLKDVFEALSVHTPCIFLMEDIHAIGERRPFLIDDTSGTDDTSYNKNQSMQGLLLKEKSSGSEGSREALYRSSKHLLSQYKKPYKEPKSLATNHFSFTFLFSDFLNKKQTKIRNNDFKPGSAALPIQVIKKENEFKYKMTTKQFANKTSNKINSFDSSDPLQLFSENINLIKKTESGSGSSDSSISQSGRNNKFSSAFEIKTNNSQLLAPPASSPFSVLILKEEKKLKHKKLVKEIPWFGLPGEQFSLVSKYNYSVRIKVALLADLVLSNLSVKLDMITDLLVIIDSVKGNRGFVVFATTHIPSILDPALRRPGRFDETINLSLNSTLYSRWSNYRYNFKYLSSYLKDCQSATKGSINKNTGTQFNPIYSNNINSNKNLLAVPQVMLKQIPLNSTYNKGITLDLFNSSLNFQGLLNNYQENSFISYQGSNELINYIYKKSSLPTQLLINRKNKTLKSSSTINNDIVELRDVKFGHIISKFKNNKSLKSSLFKIINNFKNDNTDKSIPAWSVPISEKQVNKLILSSDLAALNQRNQVIDTTSVNKVNSISQFSTNHPGASKQNNKILNISNKQLLNLKSKNYSLACKSLISLLLFTSGMDPSKSSLKWLSMLKDSNNLLNDYSIYVTMFAAKGPVVLKVILVNLIAGKIGESFVNNNFLFNFDEVWKQASSLLLNYLQKRQFSILEKSTNISDYSNLSIYSKGVNKLLSFNNKYSLMEPPSPPISNILLPAKRYENYKKTFKNEYEMLNKQNFFSGSILEKLQFHEQQRLLKRLYKYPIKEFFKSEILAGYKKTSVGDNVAGMSQYFSSIGNDYEVVRPMQTQDFNSELLNNNLGDHKAGLTTFNTSYLTLAPLEKTSNRLTKLTKISSINWSYKNILYNRHKTYLTNQWWNGQQGEHNAETTFLSDIDWRFTFVQSIGDINIDFPDSEQFYNPRNRRWILTKGDWNYWSNIESEFKDIYYHYIYDCFTSAYNYLNKNREIIDFYVERLHQQPTPQSLGLNKYLSGSLNERELLNIYKRFFTN